MKRIIIAALVVTLIFSFAGITAFAKETQTGTVTASALNVRSQPNTESDVLGLLPYGSSVELHEQVGSWYKINFMDQIAYIFGDYVAISEKKAQEQIDASVTALIETAKLYIGTPYVYGGSTPSGFDCSGFVQYVYGKIGVTLPRTSYTQATVGMKVSKQDLKVGDIVCFGSANYINHVGIYVGDGMYIHSPRTGYTVCISSIERGYSSPFMYGRRILY